MDSAGSTFKDMAFFSEQLHSARASNDPQHIQRFDEILEQCKSALAEFRQWPDGEINRAHAVGRAFWWRCIETCQATVILVDLGMATSAMSTARAAHEYLYHACALWRQPELLEKLKQKHESELTKQLNEIETHGIWSKDKTEPFRPKDSGKSGLSAIEAASAAGLQDLYAVAYRGLSQLGAHSTFISALRAMPSSEKGGHSLFIGPEFSHVKPLLDNVHMCLLTGGIRYKEAIDSVKDGRSTTPAHAGESAAGRLR